MIRIIIAALIAAITLAAGGAAGGRPRITLAHGAILAVGDSITAGVGSTDGAGYRSRLDAQLTDTGVVHTWIGGEGGPPLLHEGHSGWTIDQLAAQVRTWTSTRRPAVLVVNAGTNDDGQGRSAAQMLASLTHLLDEARAGGGPRMTIVVMQITLTPYNTAAQQQAEQEYDEGIPALAAAHLPARVVDMRDTTGEGIIGSDGVHPSDHGYEIMAQRLYPHVAACLVRGEVHTQ